MRASILFILAALSALIFAAMMVVFANKPADLSDIAETAVSVIALVSALNTVTFTSLGVARFIRDRKIID